MLTLKQQGSSWMSGPSFHRLAGSDGFRLVLADDNMYYRSMRHRCFRLANDSRASVVTIHVACDLETALSRNSGRQGVDYVPPAAIRRMAATFEAPGTTEFQQPVIRWEAGQVNEGEILMSPLPFRLTLEPCFSHALSSDMLPTRALPLPIPLKLHAS